MLAADMRYVGENSVLGFFLALRIVGRLLNRSANNSMPIATSGFSVVGHSTIPIMAITTQTRLNPRSLSDRGFL